MSKAAMVNLTLQLAHEFAPVVRVNAIAPAVVKTKFAEALYEGREAEAAAAYPLGRLGVPQDIGGAAAFLTSDAVRLGHGADTRGRRRYLPQCGRGLSEACAILALIDSSALPGQQIVPVGRCGMVCRPQG